MHIRRGSRHRHGVKQMPGINQLGGALTATAAPMPEQNGTENRGANPQSASGLQIAPNDGVTGVAVAREPKTDNNNSERRDFAALAKGRGSKRDPKTGDMVNLNRRAETRATDADEEDASRAKSNEGRAKLKRRLNDLFAPAPRVNAKADQIRASEAKAQSIAAAAAEVRERVAGAIEEQTTPADN